MNQSQQKPVTQRQRTWRWVRLDVCVGVAHLFLLAGYLINVFAQTPRITSFDKLGHLAWTNAIVPGVSTVEVVSNLSSNWSPTQNTFSITSTGLATVPVDATNKFIRLRNVDVSPTAQGFTNLIQSYGLLETICGDGIGRTDGVSYWQPQFEGGVAAYASLSRPDRKSTRLNSSHLARSRMPSSA